MAQQSLEEASPQPVGEVALAIALPATDQIASTQVAQSSPQRDVSLEEKILIISSCLSYSIYEANVYWQRNAIYLTINSIMAGALAALAKDLPSIVMLCFGIFGLFFNWHWVHVNKYSKILAERWREDARALAESSPELSSYMRALVKKPRIDAPSGKRPSDVMNSLSGSFRIIWGIVTLYSVYTIGPDAIRLIISAAKTFGTWIGII